MKGADYFVPNCDRSRSLMRVRGDKRPLRQAMAAVFLLCACGGAVRAQVQEDPAPVSPVSTIKLTVPKGAPIHVLLDKEVRIRKAGQPINGRVVEPVYAFDKLVIPAGAEVTGAITNLEGVSNGKRTAAALDANLTPDRKVDVEFTSIRLAGDKTIAMRTHVTSGSGQVTQFISAAEEKHGKATQDAATQRTSAAKQAARQEWDSAMKQVNEPDKLHRLEHFAVAELPVHPQYIEAGTTYFAELEEPLDFGAEPLTQQLATSLGRTPPDGSVVRAYLVTPLSSATAHRGDAVEAVVSQPVFDGDRLLVPAGSVLKGFVGQVEPAGRLSRNGELRPVFRELVLPAGVEQSEQKVQASLAAVQADKAENLKLDSEGGARATASPARFLTTGMAVGLGAFSMIGDSGGGDLAHRESGGAGGYKLIGIGLGAAIDSQPLGMALGAFGAGRAVYAHFIGRGRDVVLPKNTAIEISVGTRPGGAPGGAPAASAQPARQGEGGPAEAAATKP